ncbi:hypothetical protein M1146_04410, partial [Patescibacteria group bacterium]|nr:hypothetical protein [Patescibacteria group bacterium]
MFNMVPFVKYIIFVLLCLLAVFIILRIFNVKSVLSSRGIKNEISYIEEVKKKDAAILRANKFMSWATDVIEKTPLALDKTSREYWQYNITRAGIKIPGGSRYMRASEFSDYN